MQNIARYSIDNVRGGYIGPNTRVVMRSPSRRRRVNAIAFGDNCLHVCPLAVFEEDGTPVDIPMAGLKPSSVGLFEIETSQPSMNFGMAEDALRTWMSSFIDN